jgi:hypothetical protein
MAMDSTQPMTCSSSLGAEDDDSSASSEIRDMKSKVFALLKPIKGCDETESGREMRIMGGENKVGRVRDRCDIAIENKVRKERKEKKVTAIRHEDSVGLSVCKVHHFCYLDGVFTPTLAVALQKCRATAKSLNDLL